MSGKIMTAPEGANDDLLARGCLTVPGAVREFGLSRSMLYRLMESQELPYSMPFERRLIPRVALERIVRAGLIGASVADAK